MYSEIKLIYKNKKTLEKIQVRRVCQGEYVDVDTGKRITQYALKHNYMFMKGDSVSVNPTFTRGVKTPSVPPSALKGFSIKRSEKYKVCDTGAGAVWKKPWEVYWNGELLEGNFSTKNFALAYITEKTNS